MTAPENSEKKHKLLRIIAMTGLLVGAFVSLGLMLYVGRSNKSVVLMMVFTIWVLSPFVTGILLNRVSVHWTTTMHTKLYLAMLLIALGSMIIYTLIVLNQPPQPAFYFMVTPFVSLLLLALISARVAFKRPK